MKRLVVLLLFALAAPASAATPVVGGGSFNAAPLLRPLMRRAATRLWRDDLAYAERRYALRSGTT